MIYPSFPAGAIRVELKCVRGMGVARRRRSAAPRADWVIDLQEPFWEGFGLLWFGATSDRRWSAGRGLLSEETAHRSVEGCWRFHVAVMPNARQDQQLRAWNTSVEFLGDM